MLSNRFWLLASAVVLAASVVPARANLITDPGFESCANIGVTPPGWTASSANVGCGGNPHTGSWAANFAGAASTLSQTITTITGDDYDFSFWLWNPEGIDPSFTASFGSDEVFGPVSATIANYTLEDFTVAATGTSTTITFGGETHGGFWALDDVSLTDLGPSVPEPASLVLLASGLLAIAWRFRRQITH